MSNYNIPNATYIYIYIMSTPNLGFKICRFRLGKAERRRAQGSIEGALGRSKRAKGGRSKRGAALFSATAAPIIYPWNEKPRAVYPRGSLPPIAGRGQNGFYSRAYTSVILPSIRYGSNEALGEHQRVARKDAGFSRKCSLALFLLIPLISIGMSRAPQAGKTRLRTTSIVGCAPSGNPVKQIATML